jgi:hypothetical protein
VVGFEFHILGTGAALSLEQGVYFLGIRSVY